MTRNFNEFVVKIASRCNLDCAYCYEYNHGDDTWRRNARFMSEETVSRLATRIREHAASHGVRDIFLNFHGGEPLLVGPTRLNAYATTLREIVGDNHILHMGVQTNGMLVDDAMCEVLARHDISVSISLDGGKLANDRHRLDHQQRSSYEATLKGVELLRTRVPGQPNGLLAVIDVRNDPLEVFDALASLGIPHVDFLLPHFNHDKQPPRYAMSAHEYGDWLLVIFEAWIAGRHPHVDIRFFRNILLNFVGKTSNFEVMNLAPVQIVTVNTDGDIEAVDTLKSTASGAQRTGLNVSRDSFDRALQEQVVAVRFSGADQLSTTCRDCRYMRECAGGYFPHRYSSERSFDNPSVYCSDLYYLLERVEARLKVLARGQTNAIVQLPGQHG